jgi:hypothetical protein
MTFLQLSKFSVVILYFIEKKPKDQRMYVIRFCMILQYTFPKSFLKLLSYFQTIIATGMKKLKTSSILGNPNANIQFIFILK